MHELGIAANIIEIVEREIVAHRYGRVSTVALRIGKMTDVDYEALRFGFEVTARDTALSGARLEIEAVPMYNLKRGPAPGKLYHEKGRGNGYVLTYGGRRFYISGDTENVPEMRALTEIDVAFVCMNLPYTITPEEAAEAVKAFRPKVVYPYHSRGSDLALFEKSLAGTGIDVRIRDWYY